MDQISNFSWNSASILVERIFWFGLGGFLALTLLTSFLREFIKNNKKSQILPDQLENLANRAIQRNSDND